ncbi:MAG: acyl dehydratase [Burkholderiales bacterium]|jgi:hydroxyacyl-ACP dehydratase HTD2-like protein with hotdog domain|uniref:MaoC family dehydratase n=1 Tax=Orrella sp. TaxID=1921583 RepID=UPI0027695C42|nr:acyl dehydratase [Burkholderiales bacterium]
MALLWKDITKGRVIGELHKGTMSTAHIMRWCAAIENFHRIHYDLPFATEHDKLPGILINGSWKQHILAQLVKDILGEQGWLWKLSFRYKAMDLADDAISAFAEVVEQREINNLGFILIKVYLSNQAATVSTAGYAIGVVPISLDHPVPYPFEHNPAYDQMKLPRIE